MKGRKLDVLRKVLAILPVVQANQGIRVTELSRLTGIPAHEIVSDLPKLVNLCGVPPYSPMDLVDLQIEGDRVMIRFADQFRRPVRLTLSEALALDLALAGWDEKEAGPFAAAVGRIRAKVRQALSPEVAEDLGHAADGISGVEGPGRASGMVAAVKEALSLQVEIRMEYFSKNSGTLRERIARPYGLFEKRGHFYVVAWSDPPGRVVTFRADRIRSVELCDEEYEIPADFEVADYRTEGLPEPAEPVPPVRIRFEPEKARYAREFFPASGLVEEEDGGVFATVRTAGRFWLISELLRWGPAAHVTEPADLARELVQRARDSLGKYGGS